MNQRIVMNGQSEDTLQEMFKKFERKCIAKNLSDRTIMGYRGNYELFEKFYGSNKSVKEITEDTFSDFIVFLRKERPNYNDVSIVKVARDVRTFLNFMRKAGYIGNYLFALPKAVKKLKNPYTEEEIMLLLEKPNMKTVSFAKFRNWVIICYFLATGMRSSSLRNTRIKDVDLSNSEALVRHSKSGVQYKVPLDGYIKEILSEYMEIRNGSGEDFLFCTVYGQQLSQDTLKTIIRRYTLEKGATKTSAHLFRHYFAKIFVQNGGDTGRLQRLMGHEDSSQTMEYVNLYGRDLAKDYDKMNALEVTMNKTKMAGNKIKMKKR